MVCGVLSRPGEVPWPVACHKFSLGLVMVGSWGSEKEGCAPDRLITFTLEQISGCNGGSSAVQYAGN